MSVTLRQFQGLGHSRCYSNLFRNQIKVHKVEQGLNFRVGLQKNSKPLIILAYQQSDQNHQFRTQVSKSPKVFEVSSLTANGSLPCVSEASKITVEGSSRSNEQPNSCETPGSNADIHSREWTKVWEIVCSYFLTLDTTLKITMLIFVPCYAAIRLIYGVEVLNQLTPLWILGPLIVAFDIKMFQAISHLYVFSFTQTEKILRSIPSPKNLAEATYTYISQKLVKVKSIDYKKTATMKLKELMQWNENISVSFSNLSWPLYWRIVRFLTRANLI